MRPNLWLRNWRICCGLTITHHLLLAIAIRHLHSGRVALLIAERQQLLGGVLHVVVRIREHIEQQRFVGLREYALQVSEYGQKNRRLVESPAKEALGAINKNER